LLDRGELKRAWGCPTTIDFALEDSGSMGNFLSGATIVAGDMKISKDGAAFVNTTNLAVQIGGSTGIYRLALTKTEMQANNYIYLRFLDASTDDWVDVGFSIQITKSDFIFIGPVNGLDTNEGTTFKSPVKTVAEAKLRMPDGGDLLIMEDDGTFTEVGIAIENYNFIGYGGDRVLTANSASTIIDLKASTIRDITLDNDGSGLALNLHNEGKAKHCILGSTNLEDTFVADCTFKKLGQIFNDTIMKNVQAVTASDINVGVRTNFFNCDLDTGASNQIILAVGKFDVLFINCHLRNVLLTGGSHARVHFINCVSGDFEIDTVGSQGTFTGTITGTLINKSPDTFIIQQGVSSISSDITALNNTLLPIIKDTNGKVTAIDLENLLWFIRKFKEDTDIRSSGMRSSSNKSFEDVERVIKEQFQEIFRKLRDRS